MRIILKWIVVCLYLAPHSCEHGADALGPVKYWKYFERLENCWLIKRARLFGVSSLVLVCTILNDVDRGKWAVPAECTVSSVAAVFNALLLYTLSHTFTD